MQKVYNSLIFFILSLFGIVCFLMSFNNWGNILSEIMFVISILMYIIGYIIRLERKIDKILEKDNMLTDKDLDY